MAIRIENNPSPNILMNSLRAIGYSFKAALADVIDNSISANASEVNVYSPYCDDDESPSVAILDNGDGMNDGELFNAMKYGSDIDEYGLNDLGRFGVGLKSASLSQCKVLTVASKTNEGIVAYKWDVDEVMNSKIWACLKLESNEIKNIPYIDKLNELEKGTLVVWENFDTIYKKSEGQVGRYFIDEMDEAISHLELVFHRFLNDKSLKIFVNNGALIGLDPFLENNPKTDTKKPSELKYQESIIKVQTYILPHQNDLTKEDIDKLGGNDNLRNGQGFYVYRNKRLIIYGTWFRLSSNTVSTELYKYGRIKVDIPNTLDDLWEIDIKKQNAVIPKVVLNQLKNEVTSVCVKSKRKTEKRNKLSLEKDDKKIWNKSLDSNDRERFYVNVESDFIKEYLYDFDDKDKVKIVRLLEVISSTIPKNDIYNSICNRNDSKELDEETIDTIIKLGISQVKETQSRIRKSMKECFDRVCLFEPFNDDKIKELLWSAIKNDK